LWGPRISNLMFLLTSGHLSVHFCIYPMRGLRGGANNLIHVLRCPSTRAHNGYPSRVTSVDQITSWIPHGGENDCEHESKAYLNYSKTTSRQDSPYMSNLCNVRQRSITDPCRYRPTRRDYCIQRRAPPRLVGSFFMARVPGD